MSKINLSVRSLVDKYQKNCERINEIADLCESEERERSAEETKEYEALERENQYLQMKFRTAGMGARSKNAAFMDNLREAIAGGGQSKLTVNRELMLRDRNMVADVTAGGLVPDLVQSPVLPLAEATVYDKVGIPIQQGLAGNFVWPVVEFGTATINGEGAALSLQKIDFTKLTASPERIGYAYEATRESIEQSQGVLQTIIGTAIPQGVAELINAILMSPTKQVNASAMQGPFVDLVSTAQTLAASAEEISWTALNKMKAGILKEGIRGEKLAWIMTKGTAAVLEGTPINSKGIYRPMLENGMLCGVPVFTTEAITDEYIGLGDWTYQPSGFFGTPTMLVDPYSASLENSIRFIYNTHFATKTIRPEAFALAKIGA